MADARAGVHTYGDARRVWTDGFVQYMNAMVDHPVYQGMPCARDDAGKIDWTIPSNRKRGSKNWDGNKRRREWWEAKALTMGLEIEGHWISRTAKLIHPLGKKPCQPCGRVMELAYVYPTRTTIRRLNAHLPPDAELEYSAFLNIDEVLTHVIRTMGKSDGSAAVRQVFPKCEDFDDVISLVGSIRREYCDVESKMFSPGAMSNAPDRFDGFHTYNLCCRKSQDKGRASANLASYNVDRRAFEQWCEGDWAVADLVMASAGDGACMACGSLGPISADHIGPISLGFAHSPMFRPLCIRCNSAKNNRMSLLDVRDLVSADQEGARVVSWQAQPLWDRLKGTIGNDHEALVLSKLLRINQHHYLIALYEAVRLGVPDALVQFLHPEHAFHRIELIDFDPSTLSFSSVVHRPRKDRFAEMRAARIVRVAFDSLALYAAKPSRNVQVIDSRRIQAEWEAYVASLDTALPRLSAFREGLLAVLNSESRPEVRDEALVNLMNSGEKCPPFPEVKTAFVRLVAACTGVLVERFDRGEAVGWDDFD